MSFPRILSRTCQSVSPWMDLIEKTVQFAPGSRPEVYHCVTQAAYVGALVRAADGRIPIVRQFRPAVEEFTWEFPAGTVDAGESPEEAARRELREEAGLEVAGLEYLGEFHADTGRLQIPAHGFFAPMAHAIEGFHGEEGLSVRFVNHAELRAMIRTGEFRHQGHLAIYAATLVRGIDLG